VPAGQRLQSEMADAGDDASVDDRRVLRQRQRTDGAPDLELEELALRAEEAELKTRRSSLRERATAVIGKGA
jgi:hypothetical protein